MAARWASTSIIVMPQTTVCATFASIGTVLRVSRCSATGTGVESSIAVRPTVMITLDTHTIDDTTIVTLSGAS